jgi:hypothetical protein
MYIISVLGLRGLFSSRAPKEHHAHPTLEIDAVGDPRRFGGTYCLHLLSHNSVEALDPEAC